MCGFQENTCLARRYLRNVCSLFCAVIIVLSVSAQNTSQPEAEIYFGDHLVRIDATAVAQFDRGYQLFIKVWNESEGLGPNFNAKSCANCHHIPVPGGSELAPHTFVMHSLSVRHEIGGHTFQRFHVKENAIGENPLPTTYISRKTQSLFGLGLLETVPLDYLTKIEDPKDRNHDGISGRLPRISKGVGRFGWKSQSISIEEFVNTAFTLELGLTTSSYRMSDAMLHPVKGDIKPEVTYDKVLAVSTFIRLLAPPPRRTISQRLIGGDKIFDDIGCSSCHKPDLPTITKDGSNRIIHPFTDLLLHDMGPELSDGFREGAASRSEFRTAPLWGLSSAGPPFLHDGRAKNIESAILLHGGEAARSSRAFRLLAQDDKDKLLEFLRCI
jgi:CxxC motif-containing protein (DUF1111 family)